MSSNSIPWNGDNGKLICPVCKKDGYTYLRCYRPNCTDGRYLIRVVDDKKEEHTKD